MSTMIFVAAALAVASPAAAARFDAAAPGASLLALDLRGVDGVLQQGRGGGGGKQEEGGGRGQGGGNQARGSQGGGRDDAPRTERRQGGGGGQSSARSSNRGGGSDRASSSGEARGNSGGSRGSNDASERRGGSSSSAARTERGNGGSSASSRGRSDDAARGNSGSGGSNVSARATTGADVSRRSSSARGGPGRLREQDLRTRIDALPPHLRALAGSSRPGERMVAGAIARGSARGVDPNRFDVRNDGGRVRVLNRTGGVLFDMDDDRARDLGGWDLRRLGDRRPSGNAPAFCRSGAGHPVFGREWCLDKGFGLGSRNGTLWSRGGIDDVIWRRRTDDRLDRVGLGDVLGDIILGRLALQAVTLGYDQPLVGFWVADPTGPRILRVHSGDYEVAEFVDTNRDDRADVLYVVQPVYYD